MLSICDFEASGGGVKHYCMYLYDSFLEWFTAFRPPYISSGAAVRAMGVRTPPGAAARPRLCVCVCMSVNWWERERRGPVAERGIGGKCKRFGALSGDST